MKAFKWLKKNWGWFKWVLCVTAFIFICLFVFIFFNKLIGIVLGAGGFIGLSLLNKKVKYKEVTNILKDMEKANEKINNGSNDAVRDAYNSVGGSENKRD